MIMVEAVEVVDMEEMMAMEEGGGVHIVLVVDQTHPTLTQAQAYEYQIGQELA